VWADDSAFRLHVALDFRYVFYIHGVNFLPAYQLLFLLGTNLAKHSLAYRIFRVVMFPGIILVFAVGWVLYVTGKKHERPPSPVRVRTDLNTACQEHPSGGNLDEMDSEHSS